MILRVCSLPVQGHCFFCDLYFRDAEYRELFNRFRGRTEVVQREELPRCHHLGERLQGAAIALRQLSPLRSWHLCAKGHGEQAGVVCPCQDCRRSCPDYVPDAEMFLDHGR